MTQMIDEWAEEAADTIHNCGLNRTETGEYLREYLIERLSEAGIVGRVSHREARATKLRSEAEHRARWRLRTARAREYVRGVRAASRELAQIAREFVHATF